MKSFVLHGNARSVEVTVPEEDLYQSLFLQHFRRNSSVLFSCSLRL